MYPAAWYALDSMSPPRTGCIAPPPTPRKRPHLRQETFPESPSRRPRLDADGNHRNSLSTPNVSPQI